MTYRFLQGRDTQIYLGVLSQFLCLRGDLDGLCAGTTVWNQHQVTMNSLIPWYLILYYLYTTNSVFHTSLNDVVVILTCAPHIDSLYVFHLHPLFGESPRTSKDVVLITWKCNPVPDHPSPFSVNPPSNIFDSSVLTFYGSYPRPLTSSLPSSFSSKLPLLPLDSKTVQCYLCGTLQVRLTRWFIQHFPQFSRFLLTSDFVVLTSRPLWSTDLSLLQGVSLRF